MVNDQLSSVPPLVKFMEKILRAGCLEDFTWIGGEDRKSPPPFFSAYVEHHKCFGGAIYQKLLRKR